MAWVLSPLIETLHVVRKTFSQDVSRTEPEPETGTAGTIFSGTD